MTRYGLVLLPFVLLSGCSSTEPLEERIRALTWQIGAAEKASQQALVDKELAERETELAQNKTRVLEERLALAYDALREARTKLDEGLQDRLTELSESTPGSRLAISQYGGVVLESGILFTPGKHDLTAAGKTALEPMVKTLMQDTYDAYEIELAGHTDSDKIRHSRTRYRDNYDLAAMRANSVRRFLVEKGVPESRIYLASWGPTHPIDSSQKAPNRRVEILLRRKTDAVPASTPRDE